MTAPAPPAVPGGVADGSWQRVHPLTPAVHSWQALVVLLVVALQDVGQNLVREAAGDGPGGSGRGGDGSGGPSAEFLRIGLPIVGLLLVAVITLLVLSWRLTRYRVTSEALELRHGVVVRRQRRARLDRLQAVDVVQPLVARIFGLARLKLDVAGGSGSSIELSYLTDTQARQLRNHLLAAAAGLTYDTPHAPEAPEHPVVEVPVPRLVASIRSTSGCSRASSPPSVSSVRGSWPPASARSPASCRSRSPSSPSLWRRFAGAFGFTAKVSPDGLRLRHGLLEHRAQTGAAGAGAGGQAGAAAAVARAGLVARRRQRGRLRRPRRPPADRERAAPGRHPRRGGEAARAGAARPRSRAGGGRPGDRGAPVWTATAGGPTATCRRRPRPAGSTRSAGGATVCGSRTRRCSSGAGGCAGASTSCRTRAPRAAGWSRGRCSGCSGSRR